jgi:HEPN domain-containing protein
MSAPDQARSFLVLAGEDLKVARGLVGLSPRHAAFHAQQAAEKVAKAVLTARGIPFGRTHSLGQLALRFPDGDPWRQRFLGLDRVSPYATMFRYPNDATGALPPPPESDQLARDLDEIARLIPAAAAAIGMAPGEPWSEP